MRTITITGYAAGVTIPAGQSGVIPVTLNSPTLKNNDMAIFSMEYIIKNYANIPPVTPYCEIAFTKDFSIISGQWLFTDTEYSNVMFLDNFNTMFAKGKKEFSSFFPLKVEHREQINCSLFIDNSFDVTNSITPSYRIDVTFNYTPLRLVESFLGGGVI